MTKEQAEFLYCIADNMGTTGIEYYSCKDGEKMREIINALVEQQPNDDCVSIAELEKWLDLNFSFGGACRKLELFERLEKELPRVTPTFPKGATNGDMIKTMFPSASETDHFILNSPIGNIIYIRLEEYQEMRVQQDWWNAPYKQIER